MEQKYIKVPDVAAMFNVSKQTVRNWISNGILQSLFVGKKQFVVLESLKEVESQLSKIAAWEENIAQYEQDLENLEKQYNKSKDELRKCCECNKSIIKNKQLIVNLLPVLLNIIRPDYQPTDRNNRIVEMLLSGCDVREISEYYKITPSRVEQIISVEALYITKDGETYDMLKKENEKLLKKNKALKLNAISYDALKIEEVMVKKAKADLLTKEIKDCGFSKRAYNCLTYHARINTVAELVAMDFQEIKHMRQAGRKTIMELDEFVSKHGFEWGKRYMVKEDGSVVYVKSNIH